MVGRLFESRFQLKLFGNPQHLKLLLWGIVFVFLLLTQVNSTSSLMSLAHSHLGVTEALTHPYTAETLCQQTNSLNFSEECLDFTTNWESSSQIIAALEGYDVKVHGFAFENYGDEKDYFQLTAMELERLFGEQVCATKVNNECILIPLGEQWMEKKNTSMGRGHCDGMAVLSLLFYLNQVNVEEFGGKSVNSLQIEGNEKLQREIAYWWATQATEPTRSARDQNTLTPREVVNELIQAFQAGPNGEVYTIALWKRNRRGGHSVTPFAIENRGQGMFAIWVYDNNYPNTIRKIMVDSNTNTWKYNASINPNAPESEYEGDAESKTLLLTPTSFRLQIQECPFCEETLSL